MKLITKQDLLIIKHVIRKKEIMRRRLFYHQNVKKKKISKLVPSNVRLVYSTNNTTKKYLRKERFKKRCRHLFHSL